MEGTRTFQTVLLPSAPLTSNSTIELANLGNVNGLSEQEDDVQQDGIEV